MSAKITAECSSGHEWSFDLADASGTLGVSVRDLTCPECGGAAGDSLKISFGAVKESPKEPPEEPPEISQPEQALLGDQDDANRFVAGVKQDSAAALVAAGYKQTSRKHCLIARLPEGTSGLDALRRHDPRAARRFEEMVERMCANAYRRGGYARADGNELELTPEELDLFRKAGGESSQ